MAVCTHAAHVVMQNLRKVPKSLALLAKYAEMYFRERVEYIIFAVTMLPFISHAVQLSFFITYCQAIFCKLKISSLKVVCVWLQVHFMHVLSRSAQSQK